MRPNPSLLEKMDRGGGWDITDINMFAKRPFKSCLAFGLGDGAFVRASMENV